jgi:hypothetical protein
MGEDAKDKGIRGFLRVKVNLPVQPLRVQLFANKAQFFG